MNPLPVSNKPGGDLVIGVVGPCASGKSTLGHNLRGHGFEVRHIAQEHSFVRDMWEKVTQPDILIYLDVSFEQSQVRRQPNCSEAEYEEQLDRLQHARTHADYLIQTDHLTPAQVAEQALTFLLRN